jgi:hypothetical protein
MTATRRRTGAPAGEAMFPRDNLIGGVADANNAGQCVGVPSRRPIVPRRECTKLAGVVNNGARQKLDDAITELSTHTADRTGSNLVAQGATQKKAALRQVLLRDPMAPIARIVKADLPVTMELEPLRMPNMPPHP